MSLGPSDLADLSRTVELARQSIGLSEPNPRVGCVLRTASGALAGEGFTQDLGGHHAEAMALRAAEVAGVSLRGGTAWVSLEPCAHHGRTPPCCDALIAAGLGRVVVALTDPFPQVAGLGMAKLRAAGIRVDLASTCGPVESAFELNIGYFSRVIRHRPWVRMKIAASLDGRTALPNGISQWITGVEARADGHRWRQRAGAILTGIGTVRSDDPRLDVRGLTVAAQPRRVVVDSRLEIALSARILQPPGQALVVCANSATSRSNQLEDQGVEVLTLPGVNGRVDLGNLLTELAGSKVNELHVEAGPRLNAAFIDADLVDELLIYMAPSLMGAGRGMTDLTALPSLELAPRYSFGDIQRVGSDLRIVARPVDRALFMSSQIPAPH